MHETESSAPTTDFLVARIAVLELALAAERAALATSRAQIDQLTKECDHLRASHERLRQDLTLLRRRIDSAKAERSDTNLRAKMEMHAVGN
jgi:outer membrane murein-binding lipoprotein Lpp